jgi:hypothetical protein
LHLLQCDWNFLTKKNNQDKKMKPYGPFKLQMASTQSCKNTSAYLCKHPNTSIVKGRNWLVGCRFLFLVWVVSEGANLWIVQDWGNKSTCVGLTMITLVTVRMPFLGNTMSICRRKVLNMVEGNACSCSCQHSHNGNKGVTNFIMGSCVLIAMSTM